MLHLLLSLGVFGLFTSTVYGIMVVAGVLYFRRQPPCRRWRVHPSGEPAETAAWS